MKKAKVIDLGINLPHLNAHNDNIIFWWKNQRDTKINVELLQKVKDAKRLLLTNK